MLPALVASLVLAASSAQAIKVTYPSFISPSIFKSDDTWTSSGAQTLSWEFVASDPSSFALVLVNQDASLLASTVLISSSQSTSAGTVSLSYPGGGNWPVGDNFQINLLKSSDFSSAILAQTPYFSIKAGTSNIPATAAIVTSATPVAPSTLSRAAMATTTPAAIVYTTADGAAANAGLVGASQTIAAGGAAASGGLTTTPRTSDGHSTLAITSALSLCTLALLGAFFA